MPIVSMKEILKDAKSKKYAVGCYNAVDMQMIRGIIQAAEEENSPVILCHAEVHFKYTPIEKIAPVMIEEAANAKVPVALLLDHGKSFSAIMKAMHLGFNAVMFDGSELSFEENVCQTREIVKIARELNVSVEAELGHVTRPKSGGADGEEEDSVIYDKSFYTDPEKAADFVQKTGIDALAVAFGTVHGVYMTKPQLDLSRLDRIREITNMPLVMHGGSGLTAQDYENSIKNGICKINYYTNMALKAAEVIKEKLNNTKESVFYHNIMMWSIEAFKEDVKNTMKLFKSSNKA